MQQQLLKSWRLPRIAPQIDELAKFFGALASPVRLQILEMVSSTKRPLHIKAISDQLKIDYGATYRHVSVLKRSKLVEVYEVGRSRVVSPRNQEQIRKILELKVIMTSL